MNNYRLHQLDSEVKKALLEVYPILDLDDSYPETLSYFQGLIGKLNQIYSITGFKLCINPSLEQGEILDQITIIQFDSGDREESEDGELTQINKIDMLLAKEYLNNGVDASSWHRSFGTDTLILTNSF